MRAVTPSFQPRMEPIMANFEQDFDAPVVADAPAAGAAKRTSKSSRYWVNIKGIESGLPVIAGSDIESIISDLGAERFLQVLADAIAANAVTIYDHNAPKAKASASERFLAFAKK